MLRQDISNENGESMRGELLAGELGFGYGVLGWRLNPIPQMSDNILNDSDCQEHNTCKIRAYLAAPGL